MQFADFQGNVIGWARNRGIIPNATPYVQTLKLISEFGELADALAKSNEKELIDAIGDCAVVCVILAEMKGESIELSGKDDPAIRLNMPILLANSLGNINGLLIGIDYDEYTSELQLFFEELQLIARACKVDFDYCCSQAWNEIKDRTGFLTKDGVFVKDN